MNTNETRRTIATYSAAVGLEIMDRIIEGETVAEATANALRIDATVKMEDARREALLAYRDRDTNPARFEAAKDALQAACDRYLATWRK